MKNILPDEIPDDENGDVLRNMIASGDDLSNPRSIDFTVVFPSSRAAEDFASALRPDDGKVNVAETNSAPDLPWDVVVSRFMHPTHDGITEFENYLEKIAGQFGGRNDGWGCFEVPNLQ